MCYILVVLVRLGFPCCEEQSLSFKEKNVNLIASHASGHSLFNLGSVPSFIDMILLHLYQYVSTGSCMMKSICPIGTIQCPSFSIHTMPVSPHSFIGPGIKQSALFLGGGSNGPAESRLRSWLRPSLISTPAGSPSSVWICSPICRHTVLIGIGQMRSSTRIHTCMHTCSDDGKVAKCRGDIDTACVHAGR
jgi:hypothetical protein